MAGCRPINFYRPLGCLEYITPCLATKALPLSTASTIKKNFIESHTIWEKSPEKNICLNESI